MRGMAARSGPVSGAVSAPEVKPDGWKALADLARLVMRSNAPGLRWRVTLALTFTFAGKFLGVIAPLLLGKAVNELSAGKGAVAQVGLAFAGLAAGWALIRFISAAAPQARDAVFTPVAQAAQTRAAVETFAHALSLSIDFHQTKRTGSLSRVIDRGARSMDFLLRGLVFNIAPTAVELLMAAVVLAKAYDWRFALVAVVTVAIYGVLTFAISDWRIGHRREMNEADAEAAGRAVDALLNYETVKSFGAEDRAVDGYDRALRAYGAANIKATNSLTVLNTIQSAVMSLGLGVMAILAGAEAAGGRIGPGDVTAAVLILVNLYGPLNILGFAYREIRQSFIDMEAMLELRRAQPDVADAEDAIDLPPAADRRGGAVAFEAVSFRHGARSEGLQNVTFSAAPGATVAIVGPSGAGKTTLVRLALRMIDPQGGRVTLDGHDLQGSEAGLAAPRRRPGAAGRGPVQRHPDGQHRLRPPRGLGGRGLGRGRGGRVGRVHPKSARGHGHQGRRARAEAVGRRAPAGRHRPGPAGRSPGADPRRGDQRPGQPHRGRHPGHPAQGPGGAHHPGRRPPAVDHRRRRRDHGAAARQGGRARRPCGLAGGGRRIRGVVAAADSGETVGGGIGRTLTPPLDRLEQKRN
jgi:ABC-type multidrug transport system fused ATPase/permease subunit